MLRSLLSPLGNIVPRLLVNRYSTPLQWLMRAGLKRLFPGIRFWSSLVQASRMKVIHLNHSDINGGAARAAIVFIMRCVRRVWIRGCG